MYSLLKNLTKRIGDMRNSNEFYYEVKGLKKCIDAVVGIIFCN